MQIYSLIQRNRESLLPPRSSLAQLILLCQLITVFWLTRFLRIPWSIEWFVAIVATASIVWTGPWYEGYSHIIGFCKHRTGHPTMCVPICNFSLFRSTTCFHLFTGTFHYYHTVLWRHTYLEDTRILINAPWPLEQSRFDCNNPANHLKLTAFNGHSPFCPPRNPSPAMVISWFPRKWSLVILIHWVLLVLQQICPVA